MIPACCCGFGGRRLLSSLLGIALVVTILGLVVFGRSFFYYIEVKGDELGDLCAPSIETGLKMAKKELADTREISKSLEKAAIDEREASRKRDVHKSSAAIANQIKADLLQVKADLKADPTRNVFKYGGREYNREEVIRLTNELNKKYDHQKQMVAVTQEEAQAAASIAEIRTESAETQVGKVQDAKLQIAKLEARKAKIDVEKEKAHIVDSSSSQLSKVFAAIDKYDAQLTADEKLLPMVSGKYHSINEPEQAKLTEESVLASTDSLTQ